MDTSLPRSTQPAAAAPETGQPPEISAPGSAAWKLGWSRPPLEVGDLPTPEAAFGARRMGFEERLLLIVGPALVGLGVSIGSGEWMLGPLNVARNGFQGIFWVVLVSIVLQVFYNVELARYTLATGESPILGFGRTPPGAWFWIPAALICFYMAFILGGWTVSAGQSLYALVIGRSLTAADLQASRQIGVLLLMSAFMLLLFGRKVERTMELVQGAMLPYIVIGLLMVSLVVVPWSYWQPALKALVVPSRPPAGADISLLGALAGFAALASGLNYMFIGYYRDKGYGMGSRTGYISGLFGGQPGTLRVVGQTFAETPQNAALWKRWFRLLLVDQWGVYFIGCLLGMVLPSVLGGYMASLNGATGEAAARLDPVTFIAIVLGEHYGQLLAEWGLIIGFVILFSTQVVVLELLARNLTEGLFGLSARLRAWTHDDARRIYYPALVVIILLISLFIHFSLPTQLVVLSANLANFSALIFPLALIYLNRRLPRPARITWWSILALLANVIFFGFFFINFLALQITGTPLVRF